MDRSQTQAKRQIQLQIPIMKYIAALVVEVWDKLLNHRRGGCADTPTSTPSEQPCAQVPTDMNCARRVSPLGTPGPPRVCSLRGCWLDDLR